MGKINWKDVGKRAAKTFAQAFMASAGMEQMAGITDMESAKTIIWSVLVAGTSAGISAVWNMVAGYRRKSLGEAKHEQES